MRAAVVSCLRAAPREQSDVSARPRVTRAQGSQAEPEYPSPSDRRERAPRLATPRPAGSDGSRPSRFARASSEKRHTETQRRRLPRSATGRARTSSENSPRSTRSPLKRYGFWLDGGPLMRKISTRSRSWPWRSPTTVKHFGIAVEISLSPGCRWSICRPRSDHRRATRRDPSVTRCGPPSDLSSGLRGERSPRVARKSHSSKIAARRCGWRARRIRRP